MSRLRKPASPAELRLISSSPMPMLTGIVTVGFALAVLWGRIDDGKLVAWAVSILCVLVLRLGMWAAMRPIADEDPALMRWLWPQLLGIATTGFLWGLFGASFYLPQEPEIRGFILLVMGAVLGGGTVFYSGYLRAHLLYIVPCALPTAIAAFGHGSSVSIAFGFMALIYMVPMHAAARTLNRSIIGMMRLQDEKGDLATSLRAAKEAAEAANRSKSQFVADLSHELRTPLNAVIGYSEMLLEDMTDAGGTPEQIGDLEKINHAGKHLLSLLNSVLDLAKIEAGKMEIFAETVDLAELVEDVAATASYLAGKNGNTLKIEVAPGLGAIETDATKLRQVLINLLGNAAKFTKDGHIALAARRESRAGADWISITVKDTGIGMAPETLAKIFTNFTQADAQTAKKYGGTGLGLALSRKLCRVMGGELTAESEPGNGSCFTLKLPVAPAAAKSSAAFLAA